MKKLAQPLIMLAVVGASAGAGLVAGLGGATLLAALSALFCYMAAFGGTTRADLRLLTWFGPLMVLVIGGIRSLAPVAPTPALLLVMVAVFAAGMLPALGTRMITCGMGLGMASVFAYGAPVAATSLGHDLLAPAIAIVVVAATRVLLGRKDPDLPLRSALAEALATGTDPAAARERAVTQWQADGPRAWTTEAVTGVVGYTSVVSILRTRQAMLAGPERVEVGAMLDAAAAEAARLAEELRAPQPSPASRRVTRRPPGGPLPGATAQLITSMWRALERIQDASRARDGHTVPGPAFLEREPLVTALRSAITWRSAYLRHAVRCALGMGVAMLVSLLFAASPMRMTFLMAVIAIMQPQLQDSIEKARQRVYGALAGSAALALLIVLVEPSSTVLAPIGVGALLVGVLFFMQARPVVFNACIVLASVGMNVAQRHMPLRPALTDYLVLMALAVLIGLVFGFVAVPGVPRVSLAVRFGEGVAAARDLLDAVAGRLAGSGARPGDVRPVFRAASAAHQNLRANDSLRPAPSDAERDAATAAADALQGLGSSATALLMRPQPSARLVPALGELARQLGDRPNPAAVYAMLPAVIDPEQQLLLNTMIANAGELAEVAAVLAQGRLDDASTPQRRGP